VARGVRPYVPPRRIGSLHRPGVLPTWVYTDAIATFVAYLIDAVGLQRLVIDPAVDNAAAIACYSNVGFKPVGRMRRYERATNGSFHDGLLMGLLAEEFIRQDLLSPSTNETGT
jgi:aminoglycoside 6'-N-acetyltransferase